MRTKAVNIYVPLEMIDAIKSHPCYREPILARRQPPGGSGVGGFMKTCVRAAMSVEGLIERSIENER